MTLYTATSTTTTTIDVSGSTWTIGQFSGQNATVATGYASGHTLLVASNTATTLTITDSSGDLSISSEIIEGSIYELASAYGGDLFSYSGQIFAFKDNSPQEYVVHISSDADGTLTQFGTAFSSELHVGGELSGGGLILFTQENDGGGKYHVQVYWHDGSDWVSGETMAPGGVGTADFWIGRARTAEDGNVYAAFGHGNYNSSGCVYKFTASGVAGLQIITEASGNDSLDAYYTYVSYLSGVVYACSQMYDSVYWYRESDGASGRISISQATSHDGMEAMGLCRCGNSIIVSCYDDDDYSGCILSLNSPTGDISTWWYADYDSAYDLNWCASLSENTAIVGRSDGIMLLSDGRSSPAFLTDALPGVNIVSIVQVSSTTYISWDHALYKTTSGYDLSIPMPHFTIGDQLSLTESPSAYPYIVTLLDSFEQNPVQSGRVIVASSEEYTNYSGVASMSGLTSGTNTFVVSARKCQTISLSKSVDGGSTGVTTIYISRSFGDGVGM